MILPDYPIENKEQDQLGRISLASKIAELICNFEGKESFVIGVEGAWGSGKTSFINLSLQNLKGRKDIIIVNFNPWNFSNQNEVISDFFSSVFAAMRKAADKSLLKAVSSYSSKLKVSINPSVQVPLIGSIGIGELWKNGGKTLQEERAEIDAKLNSLNKKIVIVIDDIDRLDKDETRLVIKLVKMTANFPNTVFLLAYDRKRVVDRLKEDGWDGEEYLKKIIQVSFTLPEADEQGLHRILFNDLDNAIKTVYGEVFLDDEEEKRWRGIVYAGFSGLFNTVRDIKRFINSLRLNWSIVSKDDINKVDFISIEAIRVFAPQFYAAISSNKALFTGVSGLYAGFGSKDDEAAKEARYRELLQEVPKEILTPVNKICRELFPQLDFHSHYSSDSQKEWRKSRRICATERFGFYLQLGIPEGAISESEVVNLIKTLSSQKDFSENILRFNEEKRLRPMLSKILDRVESLSEGQAKILILSLWDLEKLISDERVGGFDFDNVDMQTSRILYQLLQKVVPNGNRAAFLKDIFATTKSIYFPVKFLAMFEDGNKRKSSEIFLTDQEIDDLKPILANRIDDLATNGKLPEDENFVFLLFRWKNWSGEARITSYVGDLIKQRTGLIEFVRGFVSKVFSTAGDYNRIDKGSIGNLYPVEEIEKLVTAIPDADIETMDERDKEAINLFKNPPKEW